MSSSSVSFTIRRPTPASSRAPSSGADSDRDGFKVPSLPPTHKKNSNYNSPLAKRVARDDSSSDDDAGGTDKEIITGFDKFGVTRKGPNGGRKIVDGPLIIPALKNKDWRAVARARSGRNTPSYVPGPGAGAKTGEDGSVGGLGTRDMLSTGPLVVGLTVPSKRQRLEDDGDRMDVEDTGSSGIETPPPEIVLTDDQKAINALLAASDPNSASNTADPDALEAIPLPESDLSGPPVSLAQREQAAYHRDVAALPDVSTLDDYDRVPISQYGAALLRGMGWKEGTVASRNKETIKRGIVEPYLPQQRPSLLGIGAKEREVLDEGLSEREMKKKARKAREEGKKYMPLVKVAKGGGTSTPGSASASGSRAGSRRNSRSPDRDRDRDRTREKEREPSRSSRGYNSELDRDREKDRKRDHRDDRDRDRDRERRSDKDRDRDRGDRGEREKEKDRERRREYDSDSVRERDRERRRDRGRDGR